MSLILDALNRADQERSQQDKAPGLHSGYSPETQPSPPLRRWIIEAIIIILAITAFVYSQLNQPHSAHNPVSGPAVAPTTEKKPPAIEPSATITAPAATKTMPSTAVTTSPATSPATAPAQVQAPEPATTAVAKTTTAPAAIASLYQQQPIATPTAKPVAQPHSEPSSQAPDNGLTILQQIPLLSQMSPRFQDQIPSIDYSMHVFSEKEKTGFVKLNGTTQKIGAEISPGLKVIAILEDSVVLDYHGNQFRLLALNSWVNFN
jgi:general secretion pathway protein B